MQILMIRAVSFGCRQVKVQKQLGGGAQPVFLGPEQRLLKIQLVISQLLPQQALGEVVPAAGGNDGDAAAVLHEGERGGIGGSDKADLGHEAVLEAGFAQQAVAAEVAADRDIL